jgi:hypothetical protein
MLCGLVERVLHAASMLWMLMSRLSRDWHADVAPHRLPGGESGIAKKEQQQEQHIDAEAAARAAVIAAARATRTGRTGTNIPSSGALIQKANLPAAPAASTAAAAVAAAGSKIGVMTLEADEVRVPREGGGV